MPPTGNSRHLTPAHIKEAIHEFIVNDLLFGQGDVPHDASFLETGIIDSTGVLELVAHIEETYHIKISDTELVPENLDSIDRIAGFLMGKLA